MTAVRLGLIGCGRLAESGYLPAVGASSAVEIAALADPDEERRTLLGRLVGARGPSPAQFASGAELLEAGLVDAVVVASPAAEHVPIAELAATAGVPCLVEKPPAAELAGARRLSELTPAPAVGFNRRFSHGLALAAKRPRGRFDLALELRYRRRSWDPVAVRDDALLDLAPHLIDLTFFLTRSASAELRTARATSERVELELETAAGRAQIHCATDQPHLERITITDPDGSRIAESVEGGLVRSLRSRLPGSPHPLIASLRAQLEEFAGLLRGRGAPTLARADDGVRVMEVVDAARGLAGHKRDAGASAGR